MTLFEWALAGAVVILGLVISFRIVRNGIPSLDDDRSGLLEKINSEEKRIMEDKKNISAGEQMALTEAAIRDLLSLDGLDHEAALAVVENGFLLELPEKKWLIELMMNECQLKSVRRVLHGRCQWRISGDKANAVFDDIGEMMSFLHKLLRCDAPDMAPQVHIARRVSAARPEKAVFRHAQTQRPGSKKLAGRSRPPF